MNLLRSLLFASFLIDTANNAVLVLKRGLASLSVDCIVQTIVTSCKLATRLINYVNWVTMADTDIGSTMGQAPASIETVLAKDFSLLIYIYYM